MKSRRKRSRDAIHPLLHPESVAKVLPNADDLRACSQYAQAELGAENAAEATGMCLVINALAENPPNEGLRGPYTPYQHALAVGQAFVGAAGYDKAGRGWVPELHNRAGKDGVVVVQSTGEPTRPSGWDSEGFVRRTFELVADTIRDPVGAPLQASASILAGTRDRGNKNRDIARARRMVEAVLRCRRQD